MPLEEYNKKRSFTETPEPAGTAREPSEKLIFVIQRHSATRLHYDFRLEMNGVLKSWAVPKGPSLNPSDRRLAMMTEDHPYSYRDFEGTIPEGQYGGGEVEIWDSGTYEPIEKVESKSDDLVMRHQLHKESLKFVLHGKKLKGEFALVKIKKEDNAWLLIKHKDKYALDDYDAEEHVPKRSKVTEREEYRPSKKKKTAVKKITKSKKEFAHGKDSDRKIENYIIPMLATPGGEAFDSEEWVFEIKWDGYRAIADLSGDPLLLYSRNGLSFAEKFPKVAEALLEQENEMILDGEIVAFNKEGKPDFQILQQSADHPHAHMTYQVFDLLWLNGHSTESLTLLERKELLKEALQENNVVKYCDHVSAEGKAFFKQIEKQKLEGMIAKKSDSVYAEGSRSDDWLKVKFQNTDDVVVCGFTEPKGSRKKFGAIILGNYIDGVLSYVGHVGTGFSNALLTELSEKFEPLITEQCPFEKVPKTNTPASWLKPELVCEIKYAEKTADGIYRHPVFIALRPDKNVEDVLKTNEEETEQIDTKEKADAEKSDKKTMERPNEEQKKIDKHTVKLTNQNKVYFPDAGITKGELIDYYQSVAKYILPYLKNRPQSLHRFPNGIKGLSFYQKDAGHDAPDWIEKTTIFAESNEKEIEYVICNTAADMAYLNNLGCIELNPWNSTVENIEHPDWLGLDLDPSDGNTFEDVIETALATKQVLDEAKITGYCKTSGSTGLHIYLPMEGKYNFDQVKDFAHLLMQKVQEHLPDLTTLERSLQKRSKKKIYLDYLQNRSGQTLASVYSVRPKPGAPVSMPLHWDEVKSGLKPTDFTIHNALERIKKNGDIFKPVLGKGVDMLKALQNLEKN